MYYGFTILVFLLVLIGQMLIFNLTKYFEKKKLRALKFSKEEKMVRLIELFAGVGSQAMAMRNIGVDFEHYKVVEFDKYAIDSYNAIHGTNFETSDITQIHAEDLEIIDTKSFTYLLTYLLFPLSRFIFGRGKKRNDKGRWNKKWFIVGS